MMQREDTSKTILNKSATAEIAAPMAASGASFGRQVAPVFFLTAIFFLNFIARVILSPLLPTIEKELAIGHGQAGFFFFLISAGYLSGLLGSGFLSSRTSHRQTILLSGTGVGLALFLLSGSSSLWAMRLGLYQGELVLSRNFNIVREIRSHLDIAAVIVYNRFHSRKGGVIGCETRRSASASGRAQ
ncbi:MAG: hypothetical protein ABIP88_11175 [Candidatus Binatia bacterium]